MWEKLSSRDRFLLVALLVAVWIYAVYSFILSPQIKAYARVKSELAAEKAKLARARSTAAALKTEMTRLRAAQQEKDKTGEPFKTEMRDGADIILLGLRSAAGNIDITGVEPGSIITNRHSLEILLKVMVRGNYLDVLAFINNLENQALKNLTEVRSLKVEAIEAFQSPAASSQSYSAAGDAAGGGVRAEIGLIIYSAKTPEARLQLEQLAGWLRGRGNAFQPAGAVSPVPELSGHLKLPPPPQSATPVSGQGQVQGGLPVPPANPAATQPEQKQLRQPQQ